MNRKPGKLADFNEAAARWDSPERIAMNQEMAAALRRYVPLRADMSIMDYGCGTGLLTMRVAGEVGHVTAIDSSEAMLDILRQKVKREDVGNVSVLQLDLLSDPLPEEHFDLIISCLTLHHIEDLAVILCRFHGLLLPGGRLCIIDLEKEDGTFHRNPAEYVPHHGFDRRIFTEELERVGFKNVRFEYATSVEKELASGEIRAYPLFLMEALKEKDSR